MSSRTMRHRVIAASFFAAATAAILGVFTVVEHSRSSRFVSAADDGTLRLDGRRYRFVGVNIYSLASGEASRGQYSCGPQRTEADVLAILDEVAGMGCNAVRIDAYQSFTRGGLDHSRFDLIFAAARARGIRVVVTLENHWEDCTQGGEKDAAWYRDGYRRPYGTYALSYREHVRRFVQRYRDEPAVLMWQLMNEGRVDPMDETDDPEAFYAFAADMTSLIRGIDDRHLISIGAANVDAPGTGGAYYGLLHALPNVDVVTAHDYRSEHDPYPRDIAAARVIARWLRKPFFVGEVGIRSPPFGREERAVLIARKLDAMWAADVDGILLWSYRAGDGRGNDFDLRDPLARALGRFTHRALTAPGRDRVRDGSLPYGAR